MFSLFRRKLRNVRCAAVLCLHPNVWTSVHPATFSHRWRCCCCCLSASLTSRPRCLHLLYGVAHIHTNIPTPKYIFINPIFYNAITFLPRTNNCINFTFGRRLCRWRCDSLNFFSRNSLRRFSIVAVLLCYACVCATPPPVDAPIYFPFFASLLCFSFRLFVSPAQLLLCCCAGASWSP